MALQALVLSRGRFKLPPVCARTPCMAGNIPLSHPHTSPVRPGCRTAGRYGLIRGIPRSWLSCGDPSTHPLSTVQPVAVVVPQPTPSRRSFMSQCVARLPRVPYSEPSIPSAGCCTRKLRGPNGLLSPTSYPPGFVRHIVKAPSPIPARDRIAQVLHGRSI